MDYGKELHEITDYDICEKIAENNFSNPIIANALNNIALAEEALIKAREAMIATVKLIENDTLVDHRKSIERQIVMQERHERAYQAIRDRFDNLKRISTKANKRAKPTIYTIVTESDNSIGGRIKRWLK